MTKKIRLRKGVTTGRDLCKVGNIVKNIVKDDFHLSPEETPLATLENGLNQNKDEIDLPYLCLESEHLQERGVVAVRVYDYLRNGDCIVDIKYKDRIDSFLRGCHNLAEALRKYFEESQKQLQEQLK
ncbi:MAG: hypothetical protein NZO16_00805 [Deltaproteobacteria bacterium]|nr:hypothetical protein [Deltaproteobacteria bacterium]